MEDTDALIARILDGEMELYAQIVERYERPVWRLAAAMLADRNESYEVVQQAFVNAYLHLDQYQPGRDFEKWLKEIARNCVREKLRKLLRESKHLVLYREHLDARLRDDAAWQAAEEHSTGYLAALAACRELLPDRWRDAIRQRYEEGKSFEQIATLLGGTRAAIEKLISRARAKLRDCIETRLANSG